MKDIITELSLHKIEYANIINVFGIIIRMYYAPKEHNPPHIHVYYQEQTAVINIQDGNLMEGKLSLKQLRLVNAWIEIHKDELMADWNLCQNGEKPYSIEPLK